MKLDEEQARIVDFINEAFEVAVLVEADEMDSMALDDLEAQLGELDGQVGVVVVLFLTKTIIVAYPNTDLIMFVQISGQMEETLGYDEGYG